MFKNKYINISITILLIIFITHLLGENIYLKNKESIDIYKKDTKGTFKNALSMMLETDLDSGEYERSTGTSWPTEGYIFNKELSKCENGGELDWDEENNQVLMIGASSDKCYVYFDKYTSVVINNLSLTSTPTSITATVTATAGSASISKYMFSINNGTYIESESNVHTFVGLNSSEEYSISVKVVDINGRSSAVSSETIETSAYVNPSITNLTTSVTVSTIKVTPVITQGTGTISKYYYSKDGGSSYTESTSNSYTFTDLTGGTSYNIKVYVKDNNGKTSNAYTKSVSTTNPTLAAYIKGLYTSQGSSGIYLHNSSLSNSANDNSYRYAGSNPNNYVCFGSDASTCPTDNLYRIIGVFGDQVKLIKSTYAKSTILGTDGGYSTLLEDNSYCWNESSSNTNIWSNSNLNTITLNANYISYLGTTWANKIATTTWKVGGNTWMDIGRSPMYQAYQNEIVSPAELTTYSAKVGLMYVSDYGYAASPTYWTYQPSSGSYDDSNDYRAAKNTNWMYSSIHEWTISRRSDNSDSAFVISYAGYVDSDSTSCIFSAALVRPVFYLTSSINRTGGTGNQSDPYRVA